MIRFVAIESLLLGGVDYPGGVPSARILGTPFGHPIRFEPLAVLPGSRQMGERAHDNGCHEHMLHPNCRILVAGAARNDLIGILVGHPCDLTGPMPRRDCPQRHRLVSRTVVFLGFARIAPDGSRRMVALVVGSLGHIASDRRSQTIVREAGIPGVGIFRTAAGDARRVCSLGRVGMRQLDRYLSTSRRRGRTDRNGYSFNAFPVDSIHRGRGRGLPVRLVRPPLVSPPRRELSPHRECVFDEREGASAEEWMSCLPARFWHSLLAPIHRKDECRGVLKG